MQVGDPKADLKSCPAWDRKGLAVDAAGGRFFRLGHQGQGTAPLR
jgi:hypothetical protein